MVLGELLQKLKRVNKKRQELAPLIRDHTTVLKKLEYWTKHKFKQKCKKQKDEIKLESCDMWFVTITGKARKKYQPMANGKLLRPITITWMIVSLEWIEVLGWKKQKIRYKSRNVMSSQMQNEQREFQRSHGIALLYVALVIGVLKVETIRQNNILCGGALSSGKNVRKGRSNYGRS